MSFELHDKYIVIKRDDAAALGYNMTAQLEAILSTIEVVRIERGAHPAPEYLVLRKGTAAYHAGLAALMLEVRE